MQFSLHFYLLCFVLISFPPRTCCFLSALLPYLIATYSRGILLATPPCRTVPCFPIMELSNPLTPPMEGLLAKIRAWKGFGKTWGLCSWRGNSLESNSSRATTVYSNRGLSPVPSALTQPDNPLIFFCTRKFKAKIPHIRKTWIQIWSETWRHSGVSLLPDGLHSGHCAHSSWRHPAGRSGARKPRLTFKLEASSEQDSLKPFSSKCSRRRGKTSSTYPWTIPGLPRAWYT